MITNAFGVGVAAAAPAPAPSLAAHAAETAVRADALKHRAAAATDPSVDRGPT
ncbi:hypothetical protein [Mycobacterium alsense]|nr:hypothetical protein [Mycobacterium alsense]